MDVVEDVVRRRFPTSRALHIEKVFYLPAFGRIPLNPLKLISRTVLVCITTIIVSHQNLSSSLSIWESWNP